MAKTYCSNCGEEEWALFKGLCEPCLNKLHPNEEICGVCESEWATYIPPQGLQAPTTCDECADYGAYLTHCLNN
jgi:hypothetical protein